MKSVYLCVLPALKKKKNDKIQSKWRKVPLQTIYTLISVPTVYKVLRCDDTLQYLHINGRRQRNNSSESSQYSIGMVVYGILELFNLSLESPD